MLIAPFPWFGGKSRAVGIVWPRFGDVDNYVEPFAGSLAMLLGSPRVHRTETVNDLDGFISNFWRAVASDPDGVARWADWPVSEADLHARHIWLVERRQDLTDYLMGDPDFFDAQIAGWWVWGISCWIGGGWCSGNGPWGQVEGRIANVGAGKGVSRQMPNLGSAGQGVNRKSPPIRELMTEISSRLQRVRVCCGDWTRILSSTVTTKLGVTAVFLDPPYSAEAGRIMGCYAIDSGSVAHDVREWCKARGDEPMMRIALCGYDVEHNSLEALGWNVVEWKATGGYGGGKSGRGLKNRTRERVWFSPHCERGSQLSLFQRG